MKYFKRSVVAITHKFVTKYDFTSVPFFFMTKKITLLGEIKSLSYIDNLSLGTTHSVIFSVYQDIPFITTRKKNKK